MIARFHVSGSFDRPHQEARVLVDRVAGLFSVRPKHRRRAYILPLSVVAEIVVTKIIKAEVAAARVQRKARRGQR
jgi:hypothetical protein